MRSLGKGFNLGHKTVSLTSPGRAVRISLEKIWCFHLPQASLIHFHGTLIIDLLVFYHLALGRALSQSLEIQQLLDLV